MLLAATVLKNVGLMDSGDACAGRCVVVSPSASQTVLVFKINKLLLKYFDAAHAIF